MSLTLKEKKGRYLAAIESLAKPLCLRDLRKLHNVALILSEPELYAKKPWRKRRERKPVNSEAKARSENLLNATE